MILDIPFAFRLHRIIIACMGISVWAFEVSRAFALHNGGFPRIHYILTKVLSLGFHLPCLLQKESDIVISLLYNTEPSPYGFLYSKICMSCRATRSFRREFRIEESQTHIHYPNCFSQTRLIQTSRESVIFFVIVLCGLGIWHRGMVDS
jgi:hypothetical protein